MYKQAIEKKLTELAARIKDIEEAYEDGFDKLGSKLYQSAKHDFDLLNEVYISVINFTGIRYFVKLVETTKAYPNTSYYICEYGAILHETNDINMATSFEHVESAMSIAEFINETYDFKATVIFK